MYVGERHCESEVIFFQLVGVGRDGHVTMRPTGGFHLRNLTSLLHVENMEILNRTHRKRIDATLHSLTHSLRTHLHAA